jgi:hypothetical protein
LVTARQAAEEEGVTRKRLATKQHQGSVYYGVGSRLYTESHVAAKGDRSRMEPREKAGDREWGSCLESYEWVYGPSGSLQRRVAAATVSYKVYTL